MRAAKAVRPADAAPCRTVLAAVTLLAVLLCAGITNGSDAQTEPRRDPPSLRTSCDLVNVACRKGLVDRLRRFAASQARRRTPEHTACLREGFAQLAEPGADFTVLDLGQITCAPALQDYSPEYQTSLDHLLTRTRNEIELRPGARITFGAVAEPCDYPNTVVIKSGTSLCSGVLVGDRAVLTAAHCVCTLGMERRDDGTFSSAVTRQVRVKAAEALDVGVRASGLDMSRPYQKFSSRFRCPSMFDVPDWGLDVALLFLNERLQSSCPQHFRPARVATSEAYFSQQAQIFTLVGFGLDENGGAGVKRWTRVPVVSKICGNGADTTYHCLRGLEAVMVDAAFQQDTCAGDSGGPVYLDVNGRPNLAAITSRGLRGERCGPGGIYTVVTRSVVNWMQDQGVAINAAPN